jgi:hypothetical protein
VDATTSAASTPTIAKPMAQIILAVDCRKVQKWDKTQKNANEQ